MIRVQICKNMLLPLKHAVTSQICTICPQTPRLFALKHLKGLNTECERTLIKNMHSCIIRTLIMIIQDGIYTYVLPLELNLNEYHADAHLHGYLSLAKATYS